VKEWLGSEEETTMNMNGMNRRDFLGRGSLAAIAGGTLMNLRAASKTDSAASPIANTTSGKIRGSVESKVNAFKGVPYGASTEGAGRFMPPSKPQAWTAVRDALELGPASPQIPSNLVPESMAQQPPNDANGSEDCLHLNVWTNGVGRGKRPVMVWFHGGGYSAGSAIGRCTTARTWRRSTTWLWSR